MYMNKKINLSRLWFLSKGCRQVPLEYTRGIVRWAHPNGYFLNAQGQKIAHTFSPSAQQGARDKRGRKKGSIYPCMNGGAGSTNCHVLMALAFYGPRPIDPANGKVCVCHHLIPDPLDYKPVNLLCWLTRAEHTEADRRQREIRKVVPNLRAFTYARLRQLQDPRVTSREQFEAEKQRRFGLVDPEELAEREITKYCDE